MILEMGALAEPLTKQLKGRIEKEKLERIEADSRAITRLHVRGILTDAETERARKRLMKEINSTLRAG